MVDARRAGRAFLAVYLDHVKTRLEHGGMALQPYFRRRKDARLLGRRDVLARRGKAGVFPRFDLDKYKIFPACAIMSISPKRVRKLQSMIR